MGEVYHKNMSLKYLGLDLKQTSGAIFVSQKYIDGLEFISGDLLTDNNPEVNKKGKRHLRGAVGQLNWIAFQACPEIAFDACKTAVSLKKNVSLSLSANVLLSGLIKNNHGS